MIKKIMTYFNVMREGDRVTKEASKMTEVSSRGLCERSSSTSE